MRIIAGEARGRKLLSPHGSSVRPPLDRIRESVFSLLEGAFEGRSVLDLFAGTGSLGLEALSRGARHAVFVDSEPASLVVLERNIERTCFGSRSQVFRGSAFLLPELGSVEPPGFALAFIDPPFRMFEDQRESSKIFGRVAEILASPALEPGGVIVLRCPRKAADSLPFRGAIRKTYGESIVVLLQASSETPA